jgi:hypothetical protein
MNFIALVTLAAVHPWQVSSYSAQPEYKGNSFVPSKIKITTSHSKKQMISIP